MRQTPRYITTDEDEGGVPAREPHQLGLLLDQAVGDGDHSEDGGDQPEGDPGAAEGDVHGVGAPVVTVELTGTWPPCSASLIRSWFLLS